MTDTQTITDAELEALNKASGKKKADLIASHRAKFVEAQRVASSVVEFTDFMTDTCPSDWATSLYFQES